MNLTSPSQVKAWCIESGFHPNRTLGQNFLIDRNVLDAIVSLSGVTAGQRVLEVGAGLGVLTEALLAAGAQVTAVEKDVRLADRLAGALGEPSALRVLAADALELDLDVLLAERFDACVSNLPYSVGTRILLEVARHALAPPRFTVLVQTEVAERLAAPPSCAARGQAGVWLQLDYRVAVARAVKATCFWPRPEVGSSVVVMERRPCPLLPSERVCFYELTRYAFMHRRKQLGASLRQAPQGLLGVGEVGVLAALGAAGLEPQCRAEQVTDGQWQALARAYAGLTAGG